MLLLCAAVRSHQSRLSHVPCPYKNTPHVRLQRALFSAPGSFWTSGHDCNTKSNLGLDGARHSVAPAQNVCHPPGWTELAVPALRLPVAIQVTLSPPSGSVIHYSTVCYRQGTTISSQSTGTGTGTGSGFDLGRPHLPQKEGKAELSRLALSG